MNYLFANSSLDFHKYGDFTFTSIGFKRLQTPEEVIYQNILKLLKSDTFAYELQPFYAANLTEFIGKGLDLELAKEVENRVRNVIIQNGLVPQQYLEVYSILDGHTLYLRIILFDSESYSANIELNPQGVKVN